MHKIFQLAGRFYITSSLAVLPVAIAAFIIFLMGFKENGPQLQGLGAVVVISALIFGSLGINAVIAGLLSYSIISLRPTGRLFMIYITVFASMLGLFALTVTWLS